MDLYLQKFPESTEKLFLCVTPSQFKLGVGSGTNTNIKQPGTEKAFRLIAGRVIFRQMKPFPSLSKLFLYAYHYFKVQEN